MVMVLRVIFGMLFYIIECILVIIAIVVACHLAYRLFKWKYGKLG